MSIDEAMNELAAIVGSQEFRDRQVAFFDRYCDEFEENTDENKLSYTAIHNKYEEEIENNIRDRLGAEKLQMLCAGVEEYVKSGKATSEVVMEAVNVLSSLGDFEAFKSVMLAKKAAKRVGNVALQDVKGVLQIDNVMDGTAELRHAATMADGWTVAIDEPGMVFCTKPQLGGSGTYLRYTVSINLPAPLAFRMFMDFSPESMAWREKMKDLRVVQDYGPNDKIVAYAVDIPWALKYIMSMPETLSVRIVSREQWPEAGDFAYACIPFDIEKNVAVEELGMLKIKTGVVSPDPSNPNCSTLTGMDLVNLGYAPSWALPFMLKKMVPPQLSAMTAKFKTYMNI